MSKAALTTLLGLCLVLASASSASAATPGVRDAANMFSAGALRQADAQLTDVHRKHGWEIVFETIDTLEGKSIDRATEDKARSLQVRGLYFLVARREAKIHYWIERPALNTFDKATVESATQKVIGGFKQKKFDDGLLSVVAYLAEVADRGPSATGQKALARSAPAASRPDLAPHAARDADGSGSFLGTALVVGAVIVVVLLVIRVIGAIARGASGGSGGPGYGYGGPGFGSGGGFFGNLMAGIGGALLGNYLYSSFFGGGQARASDQFGESASSSTSPVAFDDQGISGGDDWGDSASSDDAGSDGSDTGGDDFGGGDMGGGDFGGDMGGGDS